MAAARRRDNRLDGAGRGRSGQQTTEFVIILGVAALAAILVQWRVQEAVNAGARHVNDTILGVPVERPGCLDISTPKDGICDCESSDSDGDGIEECNEFQVSAIQSSSEQGSSDFTRTTGLTDAFSGRSTGRRVVTSLRPLGGTTAPGGRLILGRTFGRTVSERLRGQ